MLRDRARRIDDQAVTTLAEEARRFADPLRTREDLDPLIERIGDARFVLLGEASHGTSEFYQWRARLSSRLIAEKGFNFVAVEGDWPDCYRLNRYVKGYPEAGKNARDVLHEFKRWPTWMWANWEIVAFAEWMQQFNKKNIQQGGFLRTGCLQPVGVDGIHYQIPREQRPTSRANGVAGIPML